MTQTAEEIQKYSTALADYLKELNEQESDHKGYIFEVEPPVGAGLLLFLIIIWNGCLGNNSAV